MAAPTSPMFNNGSKDRPGYDMLNKTQLMPNTPTLPMQNKKWVNIVTQKKSNRNSPKRYKIVPQQNFPICEPEAIPA